MNDDFVRDQIRGSTQEDGLLFLLSQGGSASQESFGRAVDLDAFEAHQVIQELDRLGLVTAVDFDSIPLSLQGRRIAEAVQLSRVNGPDRWDAVQRALINALLAKRSWQDLVVDGQPVTLAELELAASRLDEWGYVKQLRGDNTVYAMHLLPRGHEVPGLTGLISDHHSGGHFSRVDNSNHVSVRGSTVAGIQTGGSGNTMHATQTITLTAGEQTQVLTILGQIAAILREAKTDVNDLGAVVATLTEEASAPAPPKPALRQRVIEAVVLAGATEGVDQVSHLLAQLLGVTS